MKRIFILLAIILLPGAGAFAADCNTSDSTWDIVATTTSACTSRPRNETINCNAAGGGFTITLITCDSTTQGIIQNFKKVDSSGNACVIDADASQTIDGAADVTLASQHAAVSLICDDSGEWQTYSGKAGNVGIGTFSTGSIADDSITEPKLKAVDSPADEECLTFESTIGDFEWQACGTGGGITINTTTITGGTSGRILYNNAGTVGELASLSTFETDLESFLDITDLQGSLAGDVDGAAGTNDLDEAAVEAELESVIDLQDLQGTVTDAQVPNTITIDGTDNVTPASLSSVAMADDKVWVGDSATDVTPRAVPDCDTAASSKLLYDTSTNSFSCGTDQSSTSGDSMPHYTSNRRWTFCGQSAAADTTFTCIAGPAVTIQGTSVSVARTVIDRSNSIIYTTNTTNNSIADVGQANWTAHTSNGSAYWDPVVTAKIATGSTITNTRICVGLAQNPNGIDYTQYATSATTTSANHAFIMVCYATDGQANTANWHFCSADGSGAANSMSCTDTGVTVNTSTVYTIKVDCIDAETNGCDSVINGTSTAMASPELITGNLGLGTFIGIRTLSGGAKTLTVASFTGEQN